MIQKNDIRDNGLEPDLRPDDLAATYLTAVVRFACPAGLRFDCLDEWLFGVFELPGMDEPATLSNRAGQPNDTVPDGATASRFLERVLAFGAMLLRVGQIPLFDPPVHDPQELIRIDATSFQGKITLRTVDLIPGQAYQRGMAAAIEHCGWMAEHPPTAENRNQIFEKIEKHVMQPLRRDARSGKSTLPVLQVAHGLGIPYLHLGLGVYQLGWGSRARRMDRSTTGADSAIGSKLAQQKVVTANLLRMAGLPAPVHGLADSESVAASIAERLGFPVVVKPSDLDRGEGVAVDVFDLDALRIAYAQAHQLARSKQVIVERQVPGVCHRLFIAHGALLYAVKRLPMSVIGDGRRTVEQLVDDEVAAQARRPTWIRSEIRPIDERALKAMAAAGFAPESVPTDGTKVPLRRIESTESGGVDEEVTTLCHPENVAVAVRAAKLFGLAVAGIDIISTDITRPWHETGAIINEVNFSPLFGGAEISRSYIPRFFSSFIEGDGRIPVEVCSSRQDAFVRFKRHIEGGRRCFFTTADETLDASGSPVVMPLQGLNARFRALICRPDVEAIVACR